MLAVSALTFALGTLAVALPAAGGPSATAAGPPARWQPAPDARWQYQLESSNRRLASTGGIRRRDLRGPPLRRRLRPPGRLRHRPLRRRPGLGERPHDQPQGRGRDPRPGRARGLLPVGRHRGALPARFPQVREVQPAPPSQPDGQALQPPIPERVLAQPQERPWAARLRPAASRGPHPEVRPGRLRRGRIRRRRRLRAGPQGDGVAHHRPQPARLQQGAGSDRASTRPLGGAQERPRPGAQAASPGSTTRSTSSAFSTTSARTTRRPATGRSPARARRSSRSSTRSRRAVSAAGRAPSGSARSRRPATSRCGRSPGSPARRR